MIDIYREYMCDVCLDNGEDTNSLSYDPNEKNFKCSKGHSESAEQMFRFEEAPELVSIIMDLLELNNKEKEIANVKSTD
jgi:hypothetical protein